MSDSKKKKNWLGEWLSNEKKTWGRLGDFIVPKFEKGIEDIVYGATPRRYLIDTLDKWNPKKDREEGRLVKKPFNPDVTEGLGEVKIIESKRVPTGSLGSTTVKTPAYVKLSDEVIMPKDEETLNEIRSKLTGRMSDKEIEERKKLGDDPSDSMTHELAHALFARMPMAERASFKKAMEDARKSVKTGNKDLSDENHPLNKILRQELGKAYYTTPASYWMSYPMELLSGLLGTYPMTNEDYAMIAEMYYDNPEENPFRHYYSNMYR